MAETLVFWLLFLLFTGSFVVQVGRRVRLVLRAPRNFTIDRPAARAIQFLRDVVLQTRTIAERPVAGLAHALVFESLKLSYALVLERDC